MKQTIFVTLAATALLGLTACKGGAAAAGGKLIPEQATIMGGIDVAGLMKTKHYSENKAMLESQREWTEMSAAAKACNLDPEKALSSILVGTDGKANFAVVITGEGLGDEKNLTCIADKAKEKNGGKTPFTIADDGGKKVLRMENGDGTGFIVDGKTLVFASKTWEAAVKDLMDGKGKAASSGSEQGHLRSRRPEQAHLGRRPDPPRRPLAWPRAWARSRRTSRSPSTSRTAWPSRPLSVSPRPTRPRR